MFIHPDHTPVAASPTSGKDAAMTTVQDPTPGWGQPLYEIVTVTPQLAKEWLEKNTHNRNLRNRAVEAYARDMASGSWVENGESIKFAEDGTLLDGQHRLRALILAGVMLRMLVVSGLPNIAQETMDDGRKRSLADALLLRGEQNHIILASALRRALMWQHGVYRNAGTNPPTITECMTFLAAHPEIRLSAQVGNTVRRQTRLPASVLSLTHWLFNQIDPNDAEWFFDRLASGAGLEQYHPIWTLRKRAADISTTPGRVPEDILLAFVIKTWNAYRDGVQLKTLRFTPGGAQPEKFPMPK